MFALPRDGSKYSVGWGGRLFPCAGNWCVLHALAATLQQEVWLRGGGVWKHELGQVGFAHVSPAKIRRSTWLAVLVLSDVGV